MHSPVISIEDVEAKMLQEEQPVCPVTNYFSDGVYLREITMPAGAVILGHRHTTRHMNIISKGSCNLKDLDTGEIVTLTAPYTFESLPGVRKLLYIIEECVWTTVHVTEETDLELLEEQLIVHSETHKELEGGLVYGMGSSRDGSSRSSDKYIKSKSSS